MARHRRPAQIGIALMGAPSFVLLIVLSLLPLHSVSAFPCSEAGICENGNSLAGEFPNCSCGVHCPNITTIEICEASGDEWTGYVWSCGCVWQEGLGPDRPPP